MSSEPSPAQRHVVHSPTPPLPESPRRNLVRWLLLGASLAAVLAIIAGRAPQVFALPGLFAAGYGALLGFGVGESARILAIGRPRWTIALACVLAIGGFAAATLQWSHAFHRRTAEWFREHPNRRDPLSEKMRTALDQAPQNESPEDRRARLETAASIEQGEQKHRELEAARRESLTFPGYLRDRLANMGPLKDLPQPWPVVFWAGELLLAGVIAGGIGWKLQAAA